jgi:type VI secretion system secreted protein Hcp
MAFDAFLKLDGIKGEVVESKHKDEIEIESFSWGVTQTGTLAFGGGGGAGKAQFQDFHFTSNTSKASPQLFIKCATGEHIKDGTLSLRKAGREQEQVFLKITLTDVLVSSYQTGGSAGGETVPTDQFSLNFAKIEYTYTPQKPDGSLDSAVQATWDIKQNKKV